MKSSEIREMAADEIQRKVDDLKEELFNLRFQHGAGQLENPQKMKLVKHSLYKKYVKRRAKFTAHDENNECKVGDTVMITESRPLSKSKRWRLTKIIEKAI